MRILIFWWSILGPPVYEDYHMNHMSCSQNYGPLLVIDFLTAPNI